MRPAWRPTPPAARTTSRISSNNQIKGAKGARQAQTWAPAPGLAGGEGMGGDGWGGRVVSLAAGGPRSSSSESGSTSSGQ